MKAAKYLFEHKLLCLCIIALMLIGYIFGFLGPWISAKLYDVGIQQGGIEYATPIQLSASQNNQLMAISDDNDSSEFKDMFYCKDDMYYINDKSQENLNAHNDQFLFYVIFMSENIDKQVTRQVFIEWKNRFDDTYAQTKAPTALKALYEASGIDTGRLQIEYLIFIGLLMLAFTAISIVIGSLQSLLSTFLSQKISLEKRKLVFDTIVDFTGKELSQYDESSLITRSTNDVGIIQSMSFIILHNVATAPVSAIVAFIFAFNIAPYLSWIILLAVALVLIAAYIVYIIARPKFVQMQQKVDRLFFATRQLLSGLMVSRSYNNQKYEEKRFDEANNDLFKIQLFVNRLTAIINPLMGFGYTCLGLLIYLIGGNFVQSGDLQVGSIMAFTSYASSVVGSFAGLGMLLGSLPKVNVSIERVEEVLNTRKNKSKSISFNECTELSKNYIDAYGLEIRFEDVDFSYTDDNNLALENLNFTINPKSTCAVIGTTGSGKSTVARLLMRVYDATSGKILINGIDISSLNAKQSREYFSYAPQDAFLFSGTIKENVEFGVSEELSDDEVYKYLNYSAADDFVKKLDDGIEYELSQDSTNVSGGQKQRLSIARALAKKASVYVFDDCFSALDFKTEKKVRKNVAEVCSDCTKIIVSQRVSSVMYADQIIVMDAGKIVGIGNHNDLLKTCSHYIEIFNSQIIESAN